MRLEVLAGAIGLGGKKEATCVVDAYGVGDYCRAWQSVARRTAETHAQRATMGIA